jgi:hypothetical protein
MNLIRDIATRIYHTTNLLPIGAVPGQGSYQIAGLVTTPYLHVIKIDPMQVSSKQFTSGTLANDIKLVSGLDAAEQVVIDVHRGFVTIQIPRPASERGSVVYTGSNVPRGSGLRVPLGLDILNEPVHFDMSRETNTNLSFLGVPGSGKSVSMRRTIVTLARNNGPDEVRFLMIEVSKDALDLRIFSHLPHLVHPVVVDPAEAVQTLAWAVAQIRQGRLGYKLVICIDEVAELVRQRPDVVDLLMTLVSQGRAVGIVNLLATQIIDKETIGEGKAVFRQIHSTVLGKVGNKQLSYILGNRGGLNAEALTGQGDLMLNSNDTTTRFAGVFTTRQELERLDYTETVNRLPLAGFTNTQAIARDMEVIPPPRFEARDIPQAIVAEGLMSLQRQVEDALYREEMRGRSLYVLPAGRVKELGRNRITFKDRDQPYIVGLYKELWKRGIKLCQK